MAYQSLRNVHPNQRRDAIVGFLKSIEHESKELRENKPGRTLQMLDPDELRLLCLELIQIARAQKTCGGRALDELEHYDGCACEAAGRAAGILRDHFTWN